MSANICVDQNSPSPKEENVERENLLESSPKVVFTSNEQKVQFQKEVNSKKEKKKKSGCPKTRRGWALKFVEWAHIIVLFILAIWFTWDVITKWKEGKSSFSVFQDERDELPTTVLCFHPYGKPSKLKNYEISSKDLVYNRFPPNKLNSPWNKYQKDMFYQMNDDFVLTFSYLTDSLEWKLYNATLVEGNNEVKIDENNQKRRKRDLVGHGFNDDIGEKNVGQGRLQAMANQQNDEPPPDDSPNVFVEKLQTAWSGICYKIQLDLHTLHGRPFFGLYFQGSLPKEDIPIPEIFITSKANANGIVGYRWNNGEELKFNLEGHEQDFKLYPIKREFLSNSIEVRPETSNVSCSIENYQKCKERKILDYDYTSCSNKCMATHLPFNKSWLNLINWKECKDLKEYVCMRRKLSHVFGHINEYCPKHCSRTEYTGKRTFLVDADTETNYVFMWNYKFASKKYEVHQEYLLYDMTGVVGTVGGTLGLFIGFSFWTLLGLIFSWMKYLIKHYWKAPKESEV